LELVHATGGIHELLLTGVKRMAHVTNADDDRRLGGTGLDHVATGATNFRIHIFRMNVCFHKRPHKLPPALPITSAKFEVFALNFRKYLEFTICDIRFTRALTGERTRDMHVPKPRKLYIVNRKWMRLSLSSRRTATSFSAR
jgi:hypothetical protein